MLNLPISEKSLNELKEIIAKKVVESITEKHETQIKELQEYLKQKLTFGQFHILANCIMGLMDEFTKGLNIQNPNSPD